MLLSQAADERPRCCLGVVLHMLLGVALGMALACLWWRMSARIGVAWEYGFVLLLLLASVWKINFDVVLPIVGQAFANLLPHGVTLASKLLFGFAAVVALRYGERRLPAVTAEVALT